MVKPMVWLVMKYPPYCILVGSCCNGEVRLVVSMLEPIVICCGFIMKYRRNFLELRSAMPPRTSLLPGVKLIVWKYLEKGRLLRGSGSASMKVAFWAETSALVAA